ncbi:MAG TPA: cation-efflux pump [Candidatus Acidoferrales bacterium]|nr:cation-efflux pump [Candidatus Acidoferrales bacterium]HEV2340519.1 cation-efflux pump [Candidatus Acidoferrales bacterium]
MDAIAEAVREKKLAALASVATAVVLVLLKIFLSVRTGSLGILSEALHSGLDFVAAVITYLSVRISDKPADADHTYGHGKFESFSAFVETGLLLLTAAYIIWEALQRLLFRASIVHPSALAVGLLALMVLIDSARARGIARVAKRFPSEALEADALHFSTDVWSTTVVLVGIAAVWLGQRLGVVWLRYTDPLAALCVAGVIIWVGSQLGKRTLEALLDVAPRGLQEKIIAAAGAVDGVMSVDRVRLRRAGQRYFVDVTISVPRTTSIEQAHATSDRVERRIEEIVPSDVVVHMEPRALSRDNLFETIRATAQRRGLAVHELSAHQLEGRLFIELHLEVDERCSLREAHRLSAELEEDLMREAGGNARINIHIEPLGARIPGGEEMNELADRVRDFINGLTPEFHELVDCHEAHVRSVEHRILVSCHCAMDGSLPITQIHDVTAALEDRVKEKFPQISRVTIHPEPVEES